MTPLCQPQSPSDVTSGLKACRTYIALFASVGVGFVVVGGLLMADGAVIVERVQYDGDGSMNHGCHIQVADAGVYCEVSMTIKEGMNGPLHVFYEIEGFYQNHRSYLKSHSWDQLHQTRKDPDETTLDTECKPLSKNGTKLLHPCGVVPNSLFNDVIALTNADVVLKEDSIAWRSDVKELYKMPVDFAWTPLPLGSSMEDACLVPNAHTARVACDPSLCSIESDWGDAPCFGYVCVGGYFDQFACDAGDLVLFKYGSHEKFQYLYETFPQVISPLVGINSEHFAVWMKTAALPKFRKLYGRITSSLKKDDILTFRIQNNFDVHAFSGKKTIVVATDRGFEFEFLGLAYLLVGSACLIFSVVFASLQLAKPRHMGNSRHAPCSGHGA